MIAPPGDEPLAQTPAWASDRAFWIGVITSRWGNRRRIRPASGAGRLAEMASVHEPGLPDLRHGAAVSSQSVRDLALLATTDLMLARSQISIRTRWSAEPAAPPRGLVLGSKRKQNASNLATEAAAAVKPELRLLEARMAGLPTLSSSPRSAGALKPVSCAAVDDVLEPRPQVQQSPALPPL